MWKILFFAFASLTFGTDLRTVSEKSDWKTTGRYDETLKLCQAFQKNYPKNIRCTDFGTTPEGRKMVALIVADKKEFSPALAKIHKKPVILFQGGIHSGEIDGKDAGFLFLRELLETKKEALKNVTLVFVPIFNIDGHERFGKYNRPNQTGPEEMGWRTTAGNLNLNRDYAKADAPEMQAMLGLLNLWDPTIYVDLHVTDGAQFQPAISVQVHPSLTGNPILVPVGKKMSEGILRKLKEGGSQALDFYPSFTKEEDPTSGFGYWISPPRFSQGYWATHQRFGILVETHSWKPYKERVMATRNTIAALVELAQTYGKSWLDAEKLAEIESATIGGKNYCLEWENTKVSKTIDFPGYHYEITDSEVSNQKWIKYFPEIKEVWKVPFFSELEPKVSVVAPKGGYLVHAAEAEWVGGKLKKHGIKFVVLKTNKLAKLEVFRSSQFEFGKTPYEGHQTLTVKGDWREEERNVPIGSLYIPMDQPNAHLVLHLLEPLSKDSFLAWGFFNVHFERKEYMESYVAEDVARQMLKDPKIAAEFKEILNDKEIAGSAEKRLDFFYKKHPSWDERFGLYPIYRSQVRL